MTNKLPVRRRRLGRPFVVGVTVVVVLVAAGVLALRQVFFEEGTAASTDATQVVGYHWLLDSYTVNGKATFAPKSYPASLELRENGLIIFTDSCNGYTSRWTAARTGFTTTDMESTLAYCDGPVDRTLLNNLPNCFSDARLAAMVGSETLLVKSSACDFTIRFTRTGAAGGG